MNTTTFRERILTEFYTAMHVVVQDNFDFLRHTERGEKAAKMFELPDHVTYMGFFLDNHQKLSDVYDLLANDKSKQIFVRVLAYRLLGHHHVKIHENFSWSDELALTQATLKYDRGESHLPATGFLGLLHHFQDIPTEYGPINLDAWPTSVVYTVSKRQYFSIHEGRELGPQPGDAVIDAGGCFGDTAVYFAKAAGERGHVYTFDPLPVHGDIIRHNITQNQLESRVTYVDLAVGDTTEAASGDAPKITRINGGFTMRGTKAFATTTIDDFCASRKIPRVDFIKMDIEGFELRALKGARSTIAALRPTLAVSLYHVRRDIYEIPLWLSENFPFYDFYLDHYTIHHEEMVLFAVPRAET